MAWCLVEHRKQLYLYPADVEFKLCPELIVESLGSVDFEFSRQQVWLPNETRDKEGRALRRDQPMIENGFSHALSLDTEHLLETQVRNGSLLLASLFLPDYSTFRYRSCIPRVYRCNVLIGCPILTSFVSGNWFRKFCLLQVSE
jgi:hypothetical protein